MSKPKLKVEEYTCESLPHEKIITMEQENKEKWEEEKRPPYKLDDKLIKICEEVREVLKEEKNKWEINREVGVSEVLAFEAGQKEERANLLEKIEEYFKDKCSWEIFRDIKEIIK